MGLPPHPSLCPLPSPSISHPPLSSLLSLLLPPSSSPARPPPLHLAGHIQAPRKTCVKLKEEVPLNRHPGGAFRTHFGAQVDLHTMKQKQGLVLTLTPGKLSQPTPSLGFMVWVYHLSPSSPGQGDGACSACPF